MIRCPTLPSLSVVLVLAAATVAVPASASARSCPSFRPALGYPAVASSINVTGISCSSARSKIRAFYKRNRNHSIRRTVKVGGYRCNLNVVDTPRTDHGYCAYRGSDIVWVLDY